MGHWGSLAVEMDRLRQEPPVVRAPYLGGFQTRDLAQITDDMIAQQETGALYANGLGLPPVFSVVRLIASTIDQLDLTVGDEPPPPWLAKPKRYGSALDLGDLVQWTVTAMALQGAAYLRCTRVGDSGSWKVEAVHPASVQVRVSSSGVVALTYLLDGREIPTVPATAPGVGVPYLLPVPYMVTPQFPQGVSPLTACRLSLLGYASVERQASSLIDQGTYSGGRLETDQDITPATATFYQERWIENRKTGKLPVLGAGLRYVNDLISPSDAQWLESRQFNMQQVAAMFGVPVDYLGMSMMGGSSSLSYANAQDNDRRFRRNCLEAFTSQIEDALTMLTPPGRSPEESQPVRFDFSGWEATGSANASDAGPEDAGQ